MRPWRAAAVVAALIAAMPALVSGGNLTRTADGLRLELASDPATPRTARPTTYRLRLSGPDGSAVGGARVTLAGRMADGMAVVAPLRAGPERGVYVGSVLFTMEGAWDLTLRIEVGGKASELPLLERVGR